MPKLFGFVLVLSLAMAAPCVRAQEEGRFNISYVKSTDLDLVMAEDNARNDLKKGLCKIYAVHGYSIRLIDIGISDEEVIRRKIPVVLIDDTSDYVKDMTVKRANAFGKAYARAYNDTVGKPCHFE